VSKGVISALEAVAAVAVVFVGGPLSLALALAAASYSTERQARAEITARNAYNASLRDRYAMVRNSMAARQLVFGRCRVSGPMFFAASYGTDNEHLTFCVALAAHEIDAIETIYFDDKPITLDGAGNVIGVQEHDAFSIVTSSATVTISKTPTAGTVTATARYGDVLVPLTVSLVSGVNITVTGATAGTVGQLDVYYQPSPDPYAPNGVTQHQSTYTVATSTQTFTLPSGALVPPPDASGVHVVYQVTNSSADDSAPISGASVSGYNVTLTGLTVGRKITIYYQTSNGASKARVRKYLGTLTQTADAGMIANLPGTWTSAHKATGVAYLVVELDYDQNAFVGGVPQVSAVVRGMKCYDPRNGTTAWTENPALHARALATHSLAGNLPANCIDDPAVIIAANIADTSTTYTVGTANYVRPLYTAGYAFSVDRKPMDGLTDLCQAMGGGWVFADGMLRLNAGGYRTPNPGTLDETWLTDDDAVQIQVGYQRATLVNTITSSFADKFQDYTQVPLPRVPPAVDSHGSPIPNPYAIADGATLSQSIQYSAVTFSGQAQYISSCLLRRQRQGLVVQMRCNYRAWQDQTFDVRNVTLSRFGWVNKPFEVIKDAQTADGSFELVLQETDPSIWNMDAGFSAVDIAPNTNMPVPWGLPPVTTLTATSGDATLLRQADGTVVPQVKVTWDTITDSRVLQGGYVEIRYWRMGDIGDTFQTFKALGTDVQAFLTGVRAGSQYIVTARTGSVVTQGPWCDQVVVTAAGKSNPPDDVSGLTAAVVYGAVFVSWTKSASPDYAKTELRVGASWAAGVPLNGSLPTNVRGTTYLWAWPTQATYTVWAAHYDTSGNISATPQSVPVTVDASINVHDGLIATASAVSMTHAKHTPDGETFRDAVISLTYTPTQNCSAVVTVSGSGSYTTGAANPFVQILGGIYISGASWSAFDGTNVYSKPGVASNSYFSVTGSRTFLSLVAGTTYVFKYLACKWDTTDTATVDSIEMRIDVNKGV
jgi:hypothetical protein